MPLSAILVDDPTRHAPFDLARVLKRCGAVNLALVVEPEPGPTPEDAGTDGTALAAACAATYGAPVPLPRYQARYLSRTVISGSRFAAADSAAALARLVRPPFVLVVFSSAATLPLIEALHADERTRALLKLGITGWRLDPDYNLTQKLVSQGKLHYHEHGVSLERLLCRRLEVMQRAHAAQVGTPAGTPPPPPPAADAVNATA